MFTNAYGSLENDDLGFYIVLHEWDLISLGIKKSMF